MKIYEELVLISLAATATLCFGDDIPSSLNDEVETRFLEDSYALNDTLSPTSNGTDLLSFEETPSPKSKNDTNSATDSFTTARNDNIFAFSNATDESTPLGYLKALPDFFDAQFNRIGEIDIPFETNEEYDVFVQIDVEVFASDCKTPSTEGVFDLYIDQSNSTDDEETVTPSAPDLKAFHILLDVNKSVVTTSNVWSGTSSEGIISACVMTTLIDLNGTQPINRTKFVFDLDYTLSSDFQSDGTFVKSLLKATDLELVLWTSNETIAIDRALQDLNISDSDFAEIEEILEKSQMDYIESEGESLGISNDVVISVSVHDVALDTTLLTIRYDMHMLFSAIDGADQLSPTDLAIATFSSEAGSANVISNLQDTGIEPFQNVAAVKSIGVEGFTTVGVTTDYFQGEIASDYMADACVCNDENVCDTSIRAAATLPIKLCIQTDSSEVEVDGISFLTITQDSGFAGTVETVSAPVIVNGIADLPAITNIEIVETSKGRMVVVETVPLFQFFIEDTPNPLTFSGTVDLRFKTDGRLLRGSFDNSQFLRSLEESAGSAGFYEMVQAKGAAKASSSQSIGYGVAALLSSSLLFLLA